MSFEGQQVFYADQGLNQHNAGREDEMGQSVNLNDAELKFMHFILETQERNTYIYR